MHIYGTSHVHAAQPIAPPHRLAATPATSGTAHSFGVDQLDLSPEVEFAAQARDLPDLREDRVASLRAEIARGTYETPEKLDLALSRLLDEIA
jgi:negative regulator of flagellin synthesis FlgM